MLKPLFLPTPEGELYLSIYHPPANLPVRGWVLHLPAFAEEMNKARPMVSRQARLLAAQGLCVVVPDLFGTGDSSGRFGDADWARWMRDISQVFHWIDQQGGQSIQLWGLRLGCILALQVAAQYPERIDQLILWHPMTSGKQCVNQFLRLRMAAGLMEGKSESTADLRRMLDAGDSIEVAGYELCPELVKQLDALEIVNLTPPAGVDTLWLEIATSENKPITPVSRKVLEAWSEHGAAVSEQVIVGDQFWTTQEIAFAPALLDATTGLVGMRPCSDAPLPDSGSVGTENTVCETVRPLLFDCDGKQLLGMLHPGSISIDIGVVLVVGGPQYRVGSHRQFVHLARALGQAGIPVLRFDYRGMGDSEGELVGFEGIHDDIHAAVNALQVAQPHVRRVILWGLCDAASPACFYAAGDPRIAGLVLLNPWARSEAGEARTYLKHYYLQRLLSAEFWKGLINGDVNLAAAGRSLRDNLSKALGLQPIPKVSGTQQGGSGSVAEQDSPLVERMYAGLSRFEHPVLLIISGRDLTAAEFTDASRTHAGFRKLLNERRVDRRELPEADHTFSREVWRKQVAEMTIDWVKNL